MLHVVLPYNVVSVYRYLFFFLCCIQRTRLMVLHAFTFSSQQYNRNLCGQNVILKRIFTFIEKPLIKSSGIFVSSKKKK